MYVFIPNPYSRFGSPNCSEIEADIFNANVGVGAAMIRAKIEHEAAMYCLSNGAEERSCYCSTPVYTATSKAKSSVNSEQKYILEYKNAELDELSKIFIELVPNRYLQKNSENKKEIDKAELVLISKLQKKINNGEDLDAKELKLNRLMLEYVLETSIPENSNIIQIKKNDSNRISRPLVKSLGDDKIANLCKAFNMEEKAVIDYINEREIPEPKIRDGKDKEKRIKSHFN